MDDINQLRAERDALLRDRLLLAFLVVAIADHSYDEAWHPPRAARVHLRLGQPRPRRRGPPAARRRQRDLSRQGEAAKGDSRRKAESER
jgi:hypothetical protein